MSERWIILVEDDPTIARLVQRTLEKVGGFKVHWTESPADVLERAQQSGCCAVIMDISLSNSQYEGKEVDGLMITRLLKAHPLTRAVPVMLLTAHAMRGDIERFLADSGADGYLSKPFADTQALIAAVNALLERAPARKGNDSDAA